MRMMSKIYREQAIGLARELKLTEDGIRGTMGWIEPKVKPDVYEKMLAVIRQSIRYGVLKHLMEIQEVKNETD
jgi:hypothetical protein